MLTIILQKTTDNELKLQTPKVLWQKKINKFKSSFLLFLFPELHSKWMPKNLRVHYPILELIQCTANVFVPQAVDEGIQHRGEHQWCSSAKPLNNF
jgi:hypothetical protein